MVISYFHLQLQFSLEQGFVVLHACWPIIHFCKLSYLLYFNRPVLGPLHSIQLQLKFFQQNFGMWTSILFIKENSQRTKFNWNSAMAICIALCCGRLGSVIGSNMVAYLLEENCEFTFYLCGSTLIGKAKLSAYFFECFSYNFFFPSIFSGWCINLFHSQHSSKGHQIGWAITSSLIFIFCLENIVNKSSIIFIKIWNLFEPVDFISVLFLENWNTNQMNELIGLIANQASNHCYSVVGHF